MVRRLLIPLFLLFALSCADSDDFYPRFDNCGWETSLEEIVNSNKENFQSKDVEILSAKLLEGVKVDSTLFFGKDYGYYPVYSKKDSVFEVINYGKSFEMLNSSLDNYAINERICSLLEHSDDYDVIELSWRCGSDRFKSISLFNKCTGELEYDNMLFNMETIQRYNGENFALFLSNSELAGIDEDFHDSNSIHWVHSGKMVAYANVTWAVQGHWTARSDYYYEDEYYRYYLNYYSYTVESSEITGSGYADSNFEYVVDWRNNTIPYQPRYEFKYLMWVGPIGGFYPSYVLSTMSQYELDNRITSGTGVFREVTGPPIYREPLVVSVRK